jgi:hypothetical protein
MTSPVNPKEYQHLLYENRKFNGRRKRSLYSSTWFFYILKDKSSEEQQKDERYHVALLDTGELVCVRCGYLYPPSVSGGAVYIGTGVVHHDEYW